MTAALVWILWPASILFTAVLSYRLGDHRGSTDAPGRHRADRLPHQDPWDEEPGSEEAASTESSMPQRPARWWSDEDDTVELPRVEQ